MEKHKERLNFYKNQKLDFKKVLDIGAFEGSWTKMFKEIFPQSSVKILLKPGIVYIKKILNINLVQRRELLRDFPHYYK